MIPVEAIGGAVVALGVIALAVHRIIRLVDRIRGNR